MDCDREGWDVTNDLISTTDANGNMTLYAYDSDLLGIWFRCSCRRCKILPSAALR